MKKRKKLVNDVLSLEKACITMSQRLLQSSEAFTMIGQNMFKLANNLTEFINANMGKTKLQKPEKLVSCVELSNDLLEKLGLGYNFDISEPYFLIDLGVMRI